MDFKAVIFDLDGVLVDTEGESLPNSMVSFQQRQFMAVPCAQMHA